MKDFDANAVKNAIVEWIRAFFENNGKDCKAVIGISGGKDSSIVAALCVEALGKERVFGVRMRTENRQTETMHRLLWNILGLKIVRLTFTKHYRQ